MKKITKKIQDAKLEDVFVIIQRIVGNGRKKQNVKDYPDGKKRTVTHFLRFYYREGNKLNWEYSIEIFPGIKDPTKSEMETDLLGLSVEGLQIKTAVLLDIKYSTIWQELVNYVLSEMPKYEYFPADLGALNIGSMNEITLYLDKATKAEFEKWLMNEYAVIMRTFAEKPTILFETFEFEKREVLKVRVIHSSAANSPTVTDLLQAIRRDFIVIDALRPVKQVKEYEFTFLLEGETSQKFNSWLNNCFHELDEYYSLDAINSGIVYRFPNLYANGLKDTSAVIAPLYDNQSRMGKPIFIKWIEVEKNLEVIITFPPDRRIVNPLLDILTGFHNYFRSARKAASKALQEIKNIFQMPTEPADGWIFRDALIRLSPVEFAKFTERLSERLFREPTDKKERVSPFEVLDVNELESLIEICPRKQEFEDADSRPFATMTAARHPDGYSKVTVKADPVNFAGVAEYWDYLVNALQGERLLLDAPPVDTVRTESKSPKDKPEALQAKWDSMSDETKKNFREAWKILNRMRKDYRRESLDGQTKEAQPKIKDWQTKVMRDLHWDVSESRLRDVKEMGEFKIIK